MLMVHPYFRGNCSNRNYAVAKTSYIVDAACPSFLGDEWQYHNNEFRGWLDAKTGLIFKCHRIAPSRR